MEWYPPTDAFFDVYKDLCLKSPFSLFLLLNQQLILLKSSDIDCITNILSYDKKCKSRGINSNTKMETSTEKKLPIYQFQTPSDLKWQAKIVNAINFILKNKKRAASQRIFSFTHKVALQLDCQKFNGILCDMEIDGKIYKNGSGKNASFFVKKLFFFRRC